MVAVAIIVAVIAGQAGPAVSQSNTSYELLEGQWIGESVAWAELGGSVEGTAATFDAVVNTEFTMLVDENGTAAGDWTLDGDGVMLMTGTVNADIIFDYTGKGVLTGDGQGITMDGEVGTQAVMDVAGTSMAFDNTEPFSVDVRLTGADCYTLDGDWVFPLESLARDADWTSVDIDGVFVAMYLGDDIDTSVIADIEQLYADERAWSEAAVESGQVNLSEVVGLVIRAQDLANRLAEANECVYARTLPPDEFRTVFTTVLTAGLLNVATFAELDGPNVQEAAIALWMIGGSDLGDVTSLAIQAQAQRIIAANMTSDADTCDPCMANGNSSEVVAAALAGTELGQDFEIEGFEYTPEQILEAAGVGGTGSAP